jgi:plastocyanin
MRSALIASMRLWILPPMALALLIAACSGSVPAPAPTTPPLAVAATSTPVPIAVDTPAPTSTSSPTPPTAATNTPVPTATPTPAPTPAAASTPVPSQTEAAPPTPTPTLGPAPTEDRVGFPEGYQENFTVFYTFDRPDRKQVRRIYANDEANSVQPGQPFPYGSILVMETWSTKQDENENVILDENGHYTPDSLGGIFIMRKEPGFGEAYEHLRSGEWEYVAFSPDGSYSTPPEETANCAFCHQGATQDRDFVFRANLAFEPGRYGTAPTPESNEVYMTSISFFPRELEVKAGTTVTWTNNDVVPHTTSALDGMWDSGVMPIGGSFSFTFDTPGTFSYICAIHPSQMRGSVEVTE